MEVQQNNRLSKNQPSSFLAEQAYRSPFHRNIKIREQNLADPKWEDHAVRRGIAWVIALDSLLRIW